MEYRDGEVKHDADKQPARELARKLAQGRSDQRTLPVPALLQPNETGKGRRLDQSGKYVFPEYVQRRFLHLGHFSSSLQSGCSLPKFDMGLQHGPKTFDACMTKCVRTRRCGAIAYFDLLSNQEVKLPATYIAAHPMHRRGFCQLKFASCLASAIPGICRPGKVGWCSFAVRNQGHCHNLASVDPGLYFMPAQPYLPLPSAKAVPRPTVQDSLSLFIDASSLVLGGYIDNMFMSLAHLLEDTCRLNGVLVMPLLDIDPLWSNEQGRSTPGSGACSTTSASGSNEQLMRVAQHAQLMKALHSGKKPEPLSFDELFDFQLVRLRLEERKAPCQPMYLRFYPS